MPQGLLTPQVSLTSLLPPARESSLLLGAHGIRAGHRELCHTVEHSHRSDELSHSQGSGDQGCGLLVRFPEILPITPRLHDTPWETGQPLASWSFTVPGQSLFEVSPPACSLYSGLALQCSQPDSDPSKMLSCLPASPSLGTNSPHIVCL